MSKAWWLLVALWMLVICACVNEVNPAAEGLDETGKSVLTINQLQAVGTHNSYHIALPRPASPSHNYSHQPLSRQLIKQGIRQFEFDIYWNEAQGFEVFHRHDDPLTTCTRLTDCIRALRDASDAVPSHHVIFVLVQPKNAFAGLAADTYLQRLDNDILSAWPRSRIVTPGEVQGDYPTLRAAVLGGAWPTIDATRGKAVFVLLDKEHVYNAYTSNRTSLAGRVMFATSPDTTDDVAAVLSIDDPILNYLKIRKAVKQGFIVRVRADTGGTANIEYKLNTWLRFRAGLGAGAHFLSTDFPVPVETGGYFIQIPGGTPSRAGLNQTTSERC